MKTGENKHDKFGHLWKFRVNALFRPIIDSMKTLYEVQMKRILGSTLKNAICETEKVKIFSATDAPNPTHSK